MLKMEVVFTNWNKMIHASIKLYAEGSDRRQWVTLTGEMCMIIPGDLE